MLHQSGTLSNYNKLDWLDLEVYHEKFREPAYGMLLGQLQPSFLTTRDSSAADCIFNHVHHKRHEPDFRFDRPLKLMCQLRPGHGLGVGLGWHLIFEKGEASEKDSCEVTQLAVLTCLASCDCIAAGR